MADFLTDEEMAKLEAQQGPPDFIPDSEIHKYESPKMTKEQVMKSFINKDLDNSAGAGEALGNAMEFIDKYTGAPVRKFITEKVTGKELDKAPTGKEQAAMMGLSTDEYQVPGIPWLSASPAGVAGVGLEAVQDPFLIGTAAIKGAKGLQSGVKTLLAGEQAGEAAAKAGANASAEATAKSAAQMAQEGSQFGKADAGVMNDINIGGGEQSIRTEGKLFDIKPPQSLDELRNWKPPESINTRMQGQIRLGEIEKVLPDLEVKPLRYHYDMLENPKAMKALKNSFENLSSKEKNQIAQYNLAMLKEAEKKSIDTIEDISQAPIRSMSDQGHTFIAKVKDLYNSRKEALSPYFKELQSAGPLDEHQAANLKVAIAENSKAAPLMTIDDTGNVTLRPNSTKTGLSDEEYNAIKRVLGDLNGEVTFQEIQRQRDFLRKKIDLQNPANTEELQKVRGILLNQLELIGEEKVPQMRDIFKAYAINERSLENIEKVIGGKIESLDAIYAANPDKVVSKILSNPNYSEIVKGYAGPEAYNELLASYMRSGYEKSFDRVRGFQPESMRRFIGQNQELIKKNLGPEQYQRLTALADHGYLAKRFLDEVNPSGTAEALLSAVKPGSFSQDLRQGGITGAITSKAWSGVETFQKQRQASKVMNEALSKGMAEASASANVGLRQKLYQNLSEKYPEMLNGINLEDVLKTQGAAAAGRGMMRDQGAEETPPQNPLPPPSQKSEDEDKRENKPDQSSIMEKVKGSPYEQVLQNAMTNGGSKSFAAANYVLMNRDNKYRRLISGEET